MKKESFFMKEIIRWGILGTGRIAPRFAASLHHQPDSVLQAVAGRKPEKAEAMKESLGALRSYGSYEALLQDPDIDAVYIALPHQLHAPWSIKALDAGKAVLCEKPAVLNETEMRMVMAKASQNGCLYMEAMKTRFVPAYRKIFELVVIDQAIGSLQRMEVSHCSDFGALLQDPDAYWNQPEQGGALLDGGCYAATWLSEYLPYDFSITSLESRMEHGIDRYIRAEMDFQGIPAVFECAMDRSRPKRVCLIGDRGEILADDLHRPVTFVLKQDGKETEYTFPYEHDDFYSQIDSFVRTLQAKEEENEILPLVASLQNARILDALKARARLQQRSGDPESIHV